MFDALLIVSFGGPEGPDDVAPFLANVTRGRAIPAERLAEVAANYSRFGGVSPLNEQNRDLVRRLRQALPEAELQLPVFWGNRNWHPFLDATMRQMVEAGVRHPLALFTSAYSSYPGCRQYRENIADALVAAGASHLTVERLGPYYNHPGFVTPFVDSTVSALARLPNGARDRARLVFTTHSLPIALAAGSGPDEHAYVRQHEEVAGLVAAGVHAVSGAEHGWDLVYQSRSGEPGQPWLEPDIGDHLAALAAAGVPGAVIVPIGFVSDHLEVVWDLDTEAVHVAGTVGLPVARAATPAADPRFVTMVVDLVRERIDRVPVAERRRLGVAGAAPDRCPKGCCRNPRGPRPAVAGIGDLPPAAADD